jgi:hypothetical protein
MLLKKNKPNQKAIIYAWNESTGSPKTGDASNITAKISKDGGSMISTDDANPTELDSTNAPGVYYFDLTQSETNADTIILYAKSSTANVLIHPVVINTLDIQRDLIEAIWAKATIDQSNGSFTAYDADKSTVLVTGMISTTGTVTTREPS